MSRRLPEEGDGDPRHRSRSAGAGAIGTIARWGLLAWLTRGMIVPAVIVCVVGAVGLVGLLVALGVVTMTVTEVHRNCDHAIGPDPSSSATATAPAAATPATEQAEVPVSASATPTANPYASMEPDDDSSEREIACINLFKVAPSYGPPIGTPNRSAAATCAAKLATRQVGRQGDQASLVRFVVYHASMTSLTGYCEPPPPADSSADEIASTVDLPPASTCPKSTEAMLMPDTLVVQGVCGQPVALTEEAVSGGDLVFWDHCVGPTCVGPTRVGVAINHAELVTVDETGFVVRQAIPAGSDTRVKRVLPERD